MYRLPKEVFDILFRAGIDPLTQERSIGYICCGHQEVFNDMKYVLQRFMPGEQGPAEEYWLYKIEEFFAGDEHEVVFKPEGSSEEIESVQTPEERGIETIVVDSLAELLGHEPGLQEYIDANQFSN